MEIFTYEGKKLNIIKKDDIWFRGKTVASILGYEDTKKAIFKHVDEEDKCSLKRLKSKGDESSPLKRNTGNMIYINESGLYSLILRSKMDKAKDFHDGLLRKFYHQSEKPVSMNSTTGHTKC